MALTGFNIKLQSPFKVAAPPVVPARKAGKSTSYNAKGLQSPNLDTEIGSSAVAPLQEIVPELNSPFIRAQTYNRMMNDAGVDVSVRVVKTPVLGAEFFMQPYSDDPQDILISQFIWDNLAGGMSAPFINALEDVLRMYEDAMSVMEKCYEVRPWAPPVKGSNSKNYTMLKKLGFRAAGTISEIVYDNNGGVNTLTQSAIQADGNTVDKKLEIAKLLIFTLNRKGGDIRGKSILRTAYPHWYYKTHFYKIDAIQKERHSMGVPRGKLMPGYTPQDKALLRQLLRNLRSNHEAFVAEPPNLTIDFIKVEGNLVDVLKSAEHHNTMILLNVMAQFMALGIEQGSGGGRSTAGGQIDMFMKALRYVANYIADVINMYLIPELVVWNFPTTNFPKLQVRNIGETRDLQMFATAVANVLTAGGIQSDDQFEAWLRTIFDAPAKDPTTTRTTGTAAAANQQQQNTPAGGTNGKGTVKPGGNGQPGKPSNAVQ